ncbi:transcriptional regulator [Ammoniphilus oxalaticus]|uniref:Transcriptional regulator n=1 Tax=Ammoniphilus oxalaticus TaxID=66863 RepID=A0A419SM03_9BACL|nr:metalloregulator ArsR/SmtB family transcription factor [Ammoniphilus oxalaticus]RKD25045.1 transcriptional regulator [Ammoniphilus oxalaticus]
MEEEKYDFLSDQTIEDVARTFKALADPTRVRILHLLSQQECSVGHISSVLKLSQSAVSHQLSYLRQLRLVKNRREGQTFYYTYDDEHVITILKQMVHHILHD